METFEILSEKPLDLGKDAPFSFNIDGSFISEENLSRLFDFLGEITLDGEQFKLWFSKNKNRAIITTSIKHQVPDGIKYSNVGTEKQLNVVDLIFKDSHLPITKSLQVDTVSSNSDYRGRGLPLLLYVVLARYGYSIISDGAQYSGGIGLWKQIARQAKDRKYVVKVWDKNTDDWVKDQHGNPIKYDGTNLAHASVWDRLTTKPTTWLVLTST